MARPPVRCAARPGAQMVADARYPARWRGGELLVRGSGRTRGRDTRGSEDRHAAYGGRARNSRTGQLLEAEHELQGLRFWDGDPTVRLLMADDDLGAMLLERCEPGTVLRALPECEQDVVISGLLRCLWRAPSAQHPFRPLSALAEYWSDETLAHIEQWPDTGLVREGLRLLTELPRTAPTEFVLATDLHAGNVLRAERQPWLVIDPKPFVGDPAYDATQHLFNCSARLRSDPEGTIRSFADLLAVDHERVRLWMFARAAAEPRDDWNNNDSVTLARAIAP